ncbi:MAG: MarR family transcriptional regulator [Actinobacteria bacterium]|nr:MarR family transcriptional regulator [Actinomycetota bacterium]MBI3686744.1 MarR family transcriptional regulator [Actinomycetota bacterium]
MATQPAIGSPHPPSELPMLLAAALRTMTDQLTQRLAEDGHEPLRPAHGATFRLVTDQPAVTSAELARQLGVTRQAAAQAVAELVDWGYLRRRPHPTDRRAQTLALTSLGRAYLARTDRICGEMEERWAQLLGADRLDAIREDLRAVLASSGPGRPSGLRPVW